MPCQQLWWTPWNDCTNYWFGIDQEDIEQFGQGEWFNVVEDNVTQVGQAVNGFLDYLGGVGVDLMQSMNIGTDIGQEGKKTTGLVMLVLGGVVIYKMIRK